MKIDPLDVTLRYFDFHKDIDALCDYFYRSPPGFMESMGLNLAFMGDEMEFRKTWLAALEENAKKGERPRTQIVSYKNELVGMHSTTHYLPKESLIMHAHFYYEKFRGLGIGTISYVKAMENLLMDFSLKEILFKTPVQNLAPMKIKEKLGLKPIGEEILDWPILLPGTRAKVFRVDLAELERIKIRLGME